MADQRYDDPALQAVADAVTAAVGENPSGGRIGTVIDVATSAAEAADPVAQALRSALAAKKAGDFEGYIKHLQVVPVPADTLMAIKECGNADVIRKHNLNTSLADEKYGPGWLNREDE